MHAEPTSSNSPKRDQATADECPQTDDSMLEAPSSLLKRAKACRKTGKSIELQDDQLRSLAIWLNDPNKETRIAAAFTALECNEITEHVCDQLALRVLDEEESGKVREACACAIIRHSKTARGQLFEQFRLLVSRWKSSDSRPILLIYVQGILALRSEGSASRTWFLETLPKSGFDRFKKRDAAISAWLQAVAEFGRNAADAQPVIEALAADQQWERAAGIALQRISASLETLKPDDTSVSGRDEARPNDSERLSQAFEMITNLRGRTDSLQQQILSLRDENSRLREFLEEEKSTRIMIFQQFVHWLVSVLFRHPANVLKRLPWDSKSATLKNAPDFSRSTSDLTTTTAPEAVDRSLEQRIADLEESLAKAELQNHANSLIRDDLPQPQKIVLQAILDLPEGAFAEAETLLKAIEGEPMIEAFVKSFTAVLRSRKWGVKCETCGKPSVLLWHKNERCAEGGSAEFSHTGTSHGGTTKIRCFCFLPKPDRRRSRS